MTLKSLPGKVCGSRKGMAFNNLIIALRIVLAAFVLFICVFLINLFINYRFNVADVQSEVLINGLIYGTGGISYTDPVTGRIYPEIIDLAQLSDGELDLGMQYPDNNLISAKITVENDDRSEVLREVYYNKYWYDNWKPLLPWENLPGIGGVKSYQRRLPVLIRDADGLRLGSVTFFVVQPKSARSRRDD